MGRDCPRRSSLLHAVLPLSRACHAVLPPSRACYSTPGALFQTFCTVMHMGCRPSAIVIVIPFRSVFLTYVCLFVATRTVMPLRYLTSNRGSGNCLLCHSLAEGCWRLRSEPIRASSPPCCCQSLLQGPSEQMFHAASHMNTFAFLLLLSHLPVCSIFLRGCNSL